MFDTTPTLRCGRFDLKLDRPRLMGILNLTPDSFSDGGQFTSVDAAVARALALIEEGADIIDLGGESTRPGAPAVSAQEELDRVMPVLEALSQTIEVPISIDTSKAEVMRAAIQAGVGMINDVRALREEGALEAVADANVALCLIHMQGEPRSMQAAPDYLDVVAEVKRFLADRMVACEFSGIDRKRLVVDPGFGFGKTLEHNLTLMRGLANFQDLKRPLLVGVSRKSMIGALTAREQPSDRVFGSIAAGLAAVAQGAAILRVHDVRATREALEVWHACRNETKIPRDSDQRSQVRRDWLLADD